MRPMHVGAGAPDGLHPWRVEPTEAVVIQRELVPRLIRRGRAPRDGVVVGIDCSPSPAGDRMLAAAVAWDLTIRRPVAVATAVVVADFPYVPGLLSFREGPAVLAAVARLPGRPRALIFDGQGTAHPRGFGLACHLGLWLDLPSVGCAKSVLCGSARPPGDAAGAWTRLWLLRRVVGALVRTRTGVKPVVVSPGHRLGLTGAIRLVMATVDGFRLPEPTRLAHQEVTRLRRQLATDAAVGGGAASEADGGRGTGSGPAGQSSKGTRLAAHGIAIDRGHS